jgi:hypothetical protein
MMELLHGGKFFPSAVHITTFAPVETAMHHMDDAA